MRDRLADFLLIDDRFRWRAILWSWLAGSIAGAIAAVSTDSHDTLAFVSIGISLIAFGSFVISYARATHRRVEIVKSRRMFMDYAYAAIAAVFFVVVERILTNPETVHAAAVRIGNNIDGKTPVGEDQIVSVRAALEIISKRAAGPALKQQIVSDYSVVSAASAYNVALKEMSRPPGPYMRGAHLEGFRTAVRANGSAMFENLEAIGYDPTTSEGIVITCFPCAVVILRGRFENLTQKLDFGTWFRCHFVNCDISYMGGPITMVQCEFERCKFEFVGSVNLEVRETIESGTALVPIPSGLQ